MKNLRYVGGEDIRELSPDDLQKLGVEDAEATLSFKKGTSTTVDDNVAEALLGRIPNLRESTEEELKQEERQLEAELGFEPYNPSDHSVAEVKEVLANANPDRQAYILDQERAGQNRKTIFQSVGAEWEEKPAEEVEEAPDTSDLDDEVAPVAVTDVASGDPVPTTTSGPANTSTSAT